MKTLFSMAHLLLADRQGIVPPGDGSRDRDSDVFAGQRREMVRVQLRKRGIRDERILEAIAHIPRHLFVPVDHLSVAYRDSPLPIGEGQTISQPYMVGAMADALELRGDERVLEIGAGSGYQAAVLSLLVREVVALELKPRLAATCRDRLAHLGFANVTVIQHDGSLGWLPSAPYDAILVSAAAPDVPQPLIDQLAEGGRLVIPVGNADYQQVLRVVKREGQLERDVLCGCRYVPLMGRYGWGGASQEASAG